MQAIPFGLFLLLLPSARGYVYERCELARELYYEHGFIRSTLGNWVCLIYHESGYNTSQLKGPGSGGSYDHGLFSIYDGFWCFPPGDFADCDVACEDLRNDDITDDVGCARFIWDNEGFMAWHGWQENCMGTDVNSWVSDCF
ncbi:unnamed protein product [Darwinula stevensoni]|uniref:lysozyme n=1 Tax=Darwinula stevensoni TaxID=69355 RepID=A0A7R8ZY00_9CRUS|nr:unnamed protein product [Darwinula stevensoni]CAG0880485.1 unnamed protein product [Darwinula stevensoni]